ncbi:MAG: hypothetical protein WEC12_00705 [Balneolaceae bacterium]
MEPETGDERLAMKTIKYCCCVLVLMLPFQAFAAAGSGDVSEKLKTYFNDVAEQVERTADADRKRSILNAALDEMTGAFSRLEAMENLPDESQQAIAAIKAELADRKNELNGREDYDRVDDDEIDDFVDFVQQSMEQALNSTITISAGTAIIIALLLILL